MFILGGFGSHLTAEFDRTCAENNIILIYILNYSPLLLQSLDVGYFAVLTQYMYYG